MKAEVQTFIKRTCAPPEDCVAHSVLRLIGLWCNARSEMFDFCSSTLVPLCRTTVVDVCVPSDGLADGIAQHRSAGVRRAELAAADLENNVGSAIEGPLRLGHGPVRSIVLLLRMPERERAHVVAHWASVALSV